LHGGYSSGWSLGCNCGVGARTITSASFWPANVLLLNCARVDVTVRAPLNTSLRCGRFHPTTR
jgi:hypothetical protein